jgi:hypothetical protein
MHTLWKVYMRENVSVGLITLPPSMSFTACYGDSFTFYWPSSSVLGTLFFYFSSTSWVEVCSLRNISGHSCNENITCRNCRTYMKVNLKSFGMFTLITGNFERWVRWWMESDIHLQATSYAYSWSVATHRSCYIIEECVCAIRIS